MKDCCPTPSADTQGKSAEAGAVAVAPLPSSQESCCAASPVEGGASDACGTVATLHQAAARSSHLAANDDCCSAKEQEIAALGAHADIKRVLQIVLVINFVMFVAEFTAGVLARSTALMADSVDMLGDALVYVLSLYALGRGLRWRAGAALVKGGVIAAFGIWVFIEVGLKLINGVTPTAQTMGIFGLIALGANLTCLALLYRYRHRDVNMSSTFECSRNDVIANTGVLVAAGGVYAFNAGWPDIVVGAIIAVLFFRSAIRVIRQAWPQFRAAEPNVAVELD